MTIINFSHPLTEGQKTKIEELAGVPIERLIEVQRTFAVEQPCAAQATALVNEVGLSYTEWQSAPLLVNLPSLSIIAGLVLAEIHGRSGHFPAVLRLRPVTGPTTTYEVAEILNLEAVRLAARGQR